MMVLLESEICGLSSVVIIPIKERIIKMANNVCIGIGNTNIGTSCNYQLQLVIPVVLGTSVCIKNLCKH